MSEYIKRFNALSDQADRLWRTTDFYTKQLDRLREAANAWPNSLKAEARFKRMSARWRRESRRLIAMSDALIEQSERARAQAA